MLGPQEIELSSPLVVVVNRIGVDLMYCFRCGSVLEQRSRSLYCASGDMYLSPVLEQALIEVTRAIPQADSNKNELKPYGFYCPACASPLTKMDKQGLTLGCRSCGLQLEPPLMFAIIELHPHAK